MNPQISSHTDTVFRRSMKGQAAALLSIASKLDDDHHRLLLLVNGLTPLSAPSTLLCP